MSNLTSWWVWGELFKANPNQVWLSRSVRHLRSGTSEADALNKEVYSRQENPLQNVKLSDYLWLCIKAELISSFWWWHFKICPEMSMMMSIKYLLRNYKTIQNEFGIKIIQWNLEFGVSNFGERNWRCIIKSRTLLLRLFFSFWKPTNIFPMSIYLFISVNLKGLFGWWVIIPESLIVVITEAHRCYLCKLKILFKILCIACLLHIHKDGLHHIKKMHWRQKEQKSY